VTSGYIDDTMLRRYRTVACAGTGSADAVLNRRRYIVDPWGTAYWIEVTRDEEGETRQVLVYSFGPNRRRDGPAGDDVRAEGALRRGS
jgi:hypothetical protein